MTDHNKLAQRIVALGVGRGPKDTFRPDMYDLGAYTPRVDAKKFCNDGRVVLALLDAVRERTTTDLYYIFMESLNLMDDGVPTAIAIEKACCEALENKDEN